MSVRKLLINGQPISLYEGVQLSQDYEIESAVSFKRTADGSLIRRAIWSGKIRTSITGKGLVPSGLSSFDFSAPYLLSCVAHRAVDSASNIITLPAARRSDVGSEPYALAFIGDEWKETGIASVVVNEYTITPVTGADLC